MSPQISSPDDRSIKKASRTQISPGFTSREILYPVDLMTLIKTMPRLNDNITYADLAEKMFDLLSAGFLGLMERYTGRYLWKHFVEKSRECYTSVFKQSNGSVSLFKYSMQLSLIS